MFPLFDEFPEAIAIFDVPLLINPILWTKFSIGILVPLDWVLPIIYFFIELSFVLITLPFSTQSSRPNLITRYLVE